MSSPTTPRRSVSREALRLAVQSHNIGSEMQLPPAPEKINLGDEMASFIRLTLDDIEVFEFNPRQKANPNYLNIKESIQARGLDQKLSVTKRPGAKKYTLARGGKTRSTILRDLWEKTGNRKFYEMDFILVPFKSDSDLLAAHLSENLHRGDMSFWDKVTGVMRLKRMVEQETEKNLTHRECVDEFKSRGLPDISRSVHALYEFAYANLQALGETCHSLTMMAVRDTLQQNHVNLCRLVEAAKKGPSIEIQLSELWDQQLRAFDLSLVQSSNDDETEDSGERKSPDWNRLIPTVEQALANALSRTHEDVRFMLDVLKTNSKATWDEIQPTVKTVSTSSPKSTEPDGTNPSEFQTPVSKLNRLPGTYVPVASQEGQGNGSGQDGGDDDDNDGGEQQGTVDRPPEHIVRQFEAEEQAKKRLQRDLAAGGGVTPPVGRKAPLSPSTSVIEHTDSNVGAEALKQKLMGLAVSLASLSPSLQNLIVREPSLPMGWMIDLPDSVLSGAALPPLAKQIFWLLARASFQFHTVANQDISLEHTNFGKFTDDGKDWETLKPEDGFDFIVSWLIDPEHTAIGNLSIEILTTTRKLIADFPEEFMELGHTLDFVDLKENHIEKTKKEIEVFIEAGANLGLLRRLFPAIEQHNINLGTVRPVKAREMLHEMALKIWDEWEHAQKTLPHDRARYMYVYNAIRNQFPDHNISLWAIDSVLQGV